MSNELSSLVKFGQVSRQFYHPEPGMDTASLTRFEKIATVIEETPQEGAEVAARRVAASIERCVAERGRCVIGLGAGRCALSVYDQLVKLYFADKVSFHNVIVFNLSELWTGKAPALYSEQSTMRRLRERLLNKIDISDDNIHTFALSSPDQSVHKMCSDYEREIDECGGLDLVLCELTKSGSLAYNDPGSMSNTNCRLTSLSNDTRTRIAESYRCDVAPMTAVTLGISNILMAREVVCVAWGVDSAKAVSESVEGPCSEHAPASYLQVHNNAVLFTDIAAASRLTRLEFPWRVTSCVWDKRLVRRAAIWLCRITGKSVLKLTSKDYNDNGLSELMVIYGGAYQVNLQVFNDMQSTITGWPGGKPDADDSSRPERALPFPKRVLVFSPHPDDAVVSMGGTLHRLVHQGHDVHVAFQTSGDVAVGDDSMLRCIMVMRRIAKRYGVTINDPDRIDKDISQRLSSMNPGDCDNADMRFIKGSVHVCDGVMGCNYVGIESDHIHELNLPFYSEHPFGRGEVTERDIAPVVQLIEQIKPHQIFFAGDINDPYGTHLRACQAVVAAINSLQGRDYMAQCRTWMYRGQWGAWDLEDIQMAVPMSPEEFMRKRDAILKHQSQIHDAPFRDSDDQKLSWQRSLDRNRATADAYCRLGFASYEAIETFVQYCPPK